MKRTMTDDEARELLLKAGIPSEQIDQDAINIAAAVCDAIATRLARKLSQSFLDSILPVINDHDAFVAKCAEMGILIDTDATGQTQ